MNNYAKKLDNLDEVDEFLQTYHLSTLNYEEIENLSRSIKSNKIELVIKSFPHRKAQTRGLHWWILPKIQRRKKKKPIPLQNTEEPQETLSSLFWDQHHLHTKPIRKHYQRTIDRCLLWALSKNLQQNTSKLNQQNNERIIHHSKWDLLLKWSISIN